MAQNSISADAGPRMRALVRSAAFGDVVTILMRAPKHKSMSLDALRVFVLPAIAHNQYLIARVRREKSGSLAAGVALWASVSDEIDKRLRATPQQPLRLSFDEWKSGPNLWLVDLVAPAALAGSIFRDLDQKIAKTRPMATQIVSPGGKAVVTTVKALVAGLKKEPA